MKTKPSISEITAPVSARRFGVELEILVPERVNTVQLTRLIEDATGTGADSSGYTHNSGNARFVVKPDSSIAREPGFYGIEIASAVLQGADGYLGIRRLCAMLNAIGCKVNTSCGFHLHIECADLQLHQMKQLVCTYLRVENQVYSLLPGSRRTGTYSKPLAEYRHYGEFDGTAKGQAQRIMACTTLTELLGLYSDRFRGINLTSMRIRGTVEVRAHSGTTDADKIIAWCEMWFGLIERAALGAGKWEGKPAAEGSKADRPLCDLMYSGRGFRHPAVTAWMHGRQAKFAGAAA